MESTELPWVRERARLQQKTHGERMARATRLREAIPKIQAGIATMEGWAKTLAVDIGEAVRQNEFLAWMVDTRVGEDEAKRASAALRAKWEARDNVRPEDGNYLVNALILAPEDVREALLGNPTFAQALEADGAIIAAMDPRCLPCQTGEPQAPQTKVIPPRPLTEKELEGWQNFVENDKRGRAYNVSIGLPTRSSPIVIPTMTEEIVQVPGAAEWGQFVRDYVFWHSIEGARPAGRVLFVRECEEEIAKLEARMVEEPIDDERVALLRKESAECIVSMREITRERSMLCPAFPVKDLAEDDPRQARLAELGEMGQKANVSLSEREAEIRKLEARKGVLARIRFLRDAVAGVDPSKAIPQRPDPALSEPQSPEEAAVWARVDFLRAEIKRVQQSATDNQHEIWMFDTGRSTQMEEARAHIESLREQGRKAGEYAQECYAEICKIDDFLKAMRPTKPVVSIVAPAMDPAHEGDIQVEGVAIRTIGTTAEEAPSFADL
jgi:hypothetical protein